MSTPWAPEMPCNTLARRSAWSSAAAVSRSPDSACDCACSAAERMVSELERRESSAGVSRAHRPRLRRPHPPFPPAISSRIRATLSHRDRSSEVTMCSRSE